MKGSDEVPIVALDDKRAFTVTPVIDACGYLVGRIQVIWQGKTVSCESKDDLRAKLRAKYPTLILLYVPACRTAVLQPLDVSFNAHQERSIKVDLNGCDFGDQ